MPTRPRTWKTHISIGGFLLSLVLSVIGQGVLKETGVLDPVIDWLSERAVKVDPDLAALVSALILSLGLYGLLLWRIWRTPLIPHLPVPDNDDDVNLDQALDWIARRSSWGRWQRARGAPTGREDWLGMSACSSALDMAAETGGLAITARPNAAIAREVLPRDFWQVACLGVREDVNRGWRVFIRSRDGVSPEVERQIAEKDYVALNAKRSEVERMWPAIHARMDAETERLLSRNNRIA